MIISHLKLKKKCIPKHIAILYRNTPFTTPSMISGLLKRKTEYMLIRFEAILVTKCANDLIIIIRMA
jgi:hypothetical protein